MAVAKKNIYQKLAEAKSEIGAISKDSTNPFFKSKYFDINNLIAHVEPILAKNGLLLLQPIEDGKVYTEIFDINDTDGIGVRSCIKLPELTDPQKLGSAITYYRRYTLASLLALQAEDDDGNSAKPKTVVITTPPVKPTLKINSPEFMKALQYMNDVGDLGAIEKKYILSPAVKDALNGK